jgi:hypothetical protein
MKWLGISYFIWFTVCALFVGCADYDLKLVPKHKPAKHSHQVHKPKPHRTPIPAARPAPKQPLYLEPTDKPTPMITIPPSALANQWTMTGV